MLQDKRRTQGILWNLPDLCRQFQLQPPGTAGLDAFLHAGFCHAGGAFLNAVEGRFACAHYDTQKKILFLARDWIGETPLHWMATRDGFIVANTLGALRDTAGDLYCYRYARAFPQSKYLQIDLSQADARCVAETCRYVNDAHYCDFASECEAARLANESLEERLAAVRRDLGAAVGARARRATTPVALLLSGGLDSLSVGVLLRGLEVPFVAYTLAVEEGGEDVTMAREFAQRLGVEHRVVTVTAADILAAAPVAVEVAETYHLYNFYCAVGMYLLGRRLADDGVSMAFCGEAVNEAVGDYHDWIVQDPITGQPRVLQRVNFERMTQPSERLLYVWGQARDRGKYNHQLGTGLAKHAGSRMVKPFLHWGLDLECPYYDRRVLARLIGLDSATIQAAGGKPGLFQGLFAAEMARYNLTGELITHCKKVRLQDASEGGSGGITPVLLAGGFDQEHLLRLFNNCFQADLDPRLDAQRLSVVAA
jgi:asparagine synthetase B (glutamine-hydrolysing)